jgi:hypothetical protein
MMPRVLRSGARERESSRSLGPVALLGSCSPGGAEGGGASAADPGAAEEGEGVGGADERRRER